MGLELRTVGRVVGEIVQTELEDDDATTDFIGTATSPIRVVHSRDFPGVRDDAPVDRPRRGPADTSRASESEDGA